MDKKHKEREEEENKTTKFQSKAVTIIRQFSEHVSAVWITDADKRE